MTAPLSNDLRERVVRAVDGGESCRSVAARFGIAVSSAVKWSERYRTTGSVAPDKMGGHRKPILEAPGVHHRADQPDAASDAARTERRAGGPRGNSIA